MPDQPIYRTTYVVEVFSRGPFEESEDDDPNQSDLAAIDYAITQGDCIGHVERKSSTIVPEVFIEREMLRIGNDGTFFDPV